MNSTPENKPTAPDEVLAARADERLAHAYQQIAQADEQIARVTEQLSRLEHKPGANSSAMMGGRPSKTSSALRGLFGLLLTAFICAAAFAWQSHYGDAAKLTIARWAPQLVSISSLRLDTSQASAQPNAPVVQLAAAEGLPSQVAPAQTPPQNLAAPAGPTSPDPAREVANLEQELRELKASQEQLANDNARTIEQLKARQEQMASDNAQAIEQLRASQEQLARAVAGLQQPKAVAAPPQQGAAARKPAPKLPSPQARAQPRAPMQLRPEEE